MFADIALTRDVHGNMDRLICPDCGKLFTSKRSLFGHKKEKHSGPVEVFPCTDCGKNFSRKANLKVSRGEDWCGVAGYNFPYISRHTEIHYISGKSFPAHSVTEYLPTEVR